MLKPSYAELMDVLNENAGENDEVTSRYTIVIAAAKRARQLIDGDEAMVEERKGKPLSTAVEEIADNKIKVVPEGEGTILDIYKKKDLKNELDDDFIKEEEPLFDDTTVESLQNEEDNDFEEEEIDITDDITDDVLDDVSDDITDDVLDDVSDDITDDFEE